MAGLPEDDPYGCFVGAPVVLPGVPGGIPIAVEDNIDVAGLPTGAALGRPGPVARQDAAVVLLLRGTGATLIGKTRMDEAALGAAGGNPHHGRTENPRVPGCSPGGSSGGSAAVVAAGYCPAALGTDTLGSVPTPAAHCGLTGLKPTRGTLPMAGIMPLSRTLDHVGIIAESVAAAAQVLAMLAVPAPAFAWADGALANQADLTALPNYGGQPAASLPARALPDGRPWGLQLIGRCGADWPLMDAARAATRLLGVADGPDQASRAMAGAQRFCPGTGTARRPGSASTRDGGPCRPVGRAG